MQGIQFSTTTDPDYERLQILLDQGHDQGRHIHTVDMPYRLTSIWQDHGCEIGIWESAGELLAWAVFQPAWWNVDYALHTSMQGSLLEPEIFSWGKDQMQKFANLTREDFYGSFEFFAESPQVQKTVQHLENQGYQKFGWSIIRFTQDLRRNSAPPQLPDGFHIRPLYGASEVNRYVELHRAAFDSEIMTSAWRGRTLQHPAYHSDLDLVAVNAADEPVGFCICWARLGVGQIEPLGVLPEYQGKGLGRALELTAAQVLQDQGIHTMVVDHASFNEAAVALSQQTGFRQSNNALRYYVEVTPE